MNSRAAAVVAIGLVACQDSAAPRSVPSPANTTQAVPAPPAFGASPALAPGPPVAAAPAPATAGAADLPQPLVTPAYRADIATLCDVLRLSKADEADPGERGALVAIYLGPNIHTDDGHKFLVAITPLQGAAHADALDREAHRVGLPSCALAAAWR